MGARPFMAAKIDAFETKAISTRQALTGQNECARNTKLKRRPSSTISAVAEIAQSVFVLTASLLCGIVIQNQSLRYATHQLATPMGIVATSAHQSGRTKSASRPRMVNTIQKIFRSTSPF